MIGMGAKSITIVRAVTADFFFDCRAAEVPSDGILFYETISVPQLTEGTILNHAFGVTRVLIIALTVPEPVVR
jgi:hypothetical protein